MNNKCPKCGAPVQEGARFCPHCMMQFYEKEEQTPTKKAFSSKKKLAVVIIACVAALAVGASGIFAFVYNKKHSPICTFETFSEAICVASTKNGIDDLWQPDSFIDTHTSESKNTVTYSAPVNLSASVTNVIFYNEGEEVYAYVCDLTEEDFESGKSIIKCITQSVCNNYFSDLDEVFDNETLYPKTVLDKPFDSFYTDLLQRTERYDADIKNGTQIQTKYIDITYEDLLIVYYIVERYGDENLYDLAVEIAKK